MKFTFPLFILAAPVFAQGTNVPIQDERLDVASCMVAATALPASYRTQLYDACIEIPARLCMARGTTEPCLMETAEQMIAFQNKHRTSFPVDVEGSPLVKRSYSRKMRNLDVIFSGDIPCADDNAVCYYDATGAALKDLFYQARRAGMNFNTTVKD